MPILSLKYHYAQALEAKFVQDLTALTACIQMEFGKVAPEKTAGGFAPAGVALSL